MDKIQKVKSILTGKPDEAAYLENGGKLCPFCGSDNISADESFVAEGLAGWQQVVCDSCHKEWTDLWQMTGIDYD